MLELQFSSQAKKFLKKIDDMNWKRITDKIKNLQAEPFPSDTKRIIGRKEKTFRVRVGDYRIQYSVFYEKNILFISDIDKRPRAY